MILAAGTRLGNGRVVYFAPGFQFNTATIGVFVEGLMSWARHLGLVAWRYFTPSTR